MPSTMSVDWKRSKPRMKKSRSLRGPPVVPETAPGTRSIARSTVSALNLKISSELTTLSLIACESGVPVIVTVSI